MGQLATCEAQPQSYYNECEVYLMKPRDFTKALDALISEGQTGFRIEDNTFELWYEGRNLDQVIWILQSRCVRHQIVNGDRVYWSHPVTKW